MRIIQSLVVFILTVAIAYAIPAIAHWDFNPANWNPTARGITALLGICFAAIFSTLAYGLYEKPKTK